MTLEQASAGAILQPQEGDSLSLKTFKMALFYLLAFSNKKNPENVLQWRELIYRVENMDQTILAGAFLIYLQMRRTAKKKKIELPDDMLEWSHKKYQKIYTAAAEPIVAEIVKQMSGKKKSTREIDPIELQADAILRYIGIVASTLKENNVEL